MAPTTADAILKMKINFTDDGKGKCQARAEQNFSTGGGHGDFCLTAYGKTENEAYANLLQLALNMVRELETLKGQ